MAVPAIFHTIEQTSASIWLRETDSLFGFWFFLSWHAIGMVLLVGASTVVGLRVLGVARDLPLAPLTSLYRYMWIGFWIQIVSGTVLLYAYPTKILTNLDFYLKLIFIAIAVYLMQRLKSRVLNDPRMSETVMSSGRAIAVAVLICWVGAISAGRVLAYTYTYLSYPV